MVLAMGGHFMSRYMAGVSIDIGWGLAGYE